MPQTAPIVDRRLVDGSDLLFFMLVAMASAMKFLTDHIVQIEVAAGSGAVAFAETTSSMVRLGGRQCCFPCLHHDCSQAIRSFASVVSFLKGGGREAGGWRSLDRVRDQSTSMFLNSTQRLHSGHLGFAIHADVDKISLHLIKALAFWKLGLALF